MVKRKLLQKDHYDQIAPNFSTTQDQDDQDQSDGEVKACPKIKFFNIFDYIVLFCLSLYGIISFLMLFEATSWHLSAVGRILLIKLLPVYDWRHLKNRQCLIEKNQDYFVEDLLNCDLCENIRGVDVLAALEPKNFEERYIKLDKPVIVTEGLSSWPKNSSFLDELLFDGYFSSSIPCKLSSNIVKELNDAGEVLQKARNFDEFFLHFQNCDHEAMRILRRFTYRPDMLPDIYSPTTYNWILWNKNYNISSYKGIDLIEKLTLVGQIVGSTHVRLVPRKNCEQVCSSLSFTLDQGEMLVFTSLWDFEYRCNEVAENLAVIMEIRD